MLYGILGVTAVFFLLSPAMGQAELRRPEVSIMCRHSKEVRTLRVEKLDDGSCRSIYTKAGKDQKIGSGLYQNSCEGFVNQVRDVLEDANWKCREVQEAQLSNLLDQR